MYSRRGGGCHDEIRQAREAHPDPCCVRRRHLRRDRSTQAVKGLAACLSDVPQSETSVSAWPKAAAWMPPTRHHCDTRALSPLSAQVAGRPGGNKKESVDAACRALLLGQETLVLFFLTLPQASLRLCIAGPSCTLPLTLPSECNPLATCVYCFRNRTE
jgi:hypothetical protein